jgi:ABC-type transporter MlaC component
VPPVSIYQMIHCIESHHFSTAKARRTRREKVMNKTKEEIEQTAEQVVDAMLTAHCLLGPGLLESTDQGRH